MIVCIVEEYREERLKLFKLGNKNTHYNYI